MQRDFSSLSNPVFDMLVIGGGATGAAIAGMPLCADLVAIIDKSDFSAATSAASSKLIHGVCAIGKWRNWAGARRFARATRVWGRIATHLVQPCPSFCQHMRPYAEQMDNGARTDGI